MIKKKKLLILILLCVFEPITASIQDSISALNLDSNKYPIYKISLILFINNQVSSLSKLETFQEPEVFNNKLEYIELAIKPELLIDVNSINLAFKKDKPSLVNLEENNSPMDSKEEKYEIKQDKIGLPVQLYELLDSELLKTLSIKEKLEKSNSYNLVFSGSWYQPVFPLNLKNLIYIDYEKDNFKIYGHLSQYKENYLHSEVNLKLAEKNPGDESFLRPNNLVNFNQTRKEMRSSNTNFRVILDKLNALNPLPALLKLQKIDQLSVEMEQPFTVNDLYQIKEERKMEEGVYNYFDHPYFGVLVKIEKIK